MGLQNPPIYKKNLFQVTLADGVLWPSILDTKYSAKAIDEHNYQIYLQQHTPNEFLSEILSTATAIVGFQEILPTVNDIFIQKVKDSNHG